MSTHFECSLEEGCYYHIYNRGNDGINLFYKPGNYIYFLRKYHAYLSDYVETYETLPFYWTAKWIKLILIKMLLIQRTSH
jgi:hypothetical protein